MLATLTAALLLTAAPAGAFISGEYGVQLRKPVWVRSGPLQYHGGPVIHHADNYVIYWDPLELYNSTWMRLIDGYFHNVGEASGEMGDTFGLNAQYGETGYGTGPAASEKAKEAHAADQSTFRGAYTDTDPYPTSGDCTERAEVVCLTDLEIRAELQKVIKSGALPGATGTVPGAQSTPVYYIMTPPGVTVCTETSTPGTCSNSATQEQEAREIKEGQIKHPAYTGICGYHSAINPHSSAPVVYAVQPWVAGDAGMYVESESPLTTTGPTADVLACQDNKSLEEPNQLGYNPFAYYGAGLADVIVNDLANEQSDIAVDPLLNGWYQNASSEEHGYPEQGDMCKYVFSTSGEGGEESSAANESLTHAGSTSNETVGGGGYYLHWGFNSSGYSTGKDTAGCWQGATLEPHFTATNPVKGGDVVALDANESYITMDAAPMDLRLGKEETRMAEEVFLTEIQRADLADKISELEGEAAKLTSEKASLAGDITKLNGEVVQLKKEEERVAADEAKLAEERKEAEEKGLLTSEKEKELAEREKALTEEHKRVAEHKASDEKEKKADEEKKTGVEKGIRADEEKKALYKEYERFVEGDKVIAEEEEKLADEHRLIKEREPFLAPIYKWDFGYQENGKEVTEEGEEKASVFHTFPCAGTYTVGLTAVDGGGNEISFGGKEITVEGKQCESSSGGGSGGSSSGGSGASSGASVTAGASSLSTSSSAGSSAGTTVKPKLPVPTAAQAVIPSSLSRATRKGLIVKYSVNEQVTGTFNVLLNAQIAKRLGLHYPLAQGLPAGTVPQEIVGKALLITTKGGRGTMKIEFGKVTGARLRRLGKVSLMLQLNLRNASGGTTTVLSKIALR
jgi:hypothetical protein